MYYDLIRYRHITVELLSNQRARSFVVVYDLRHKEKIGLRFKNGTPFSPS